MRQSGRFLSKAVFVGFLLFFSIGVCRSSESGGTSHQSSEVVKIIQPPRLLNPSQVTGMLRSYYEDALRRRSQYAENERNEEQGVVFADLSISTIGTVTDVDIVKSGGMEFRCAVMNIAQKMKFSPALNLKDSKPVAVKITQKFDFRLSGPESPTDPGYQP